MTVLQALLLAPVAVLSPGLGLIFALSISGRWLLVDLRRQRVFFPALCAGIGGLWAFSPILPGSPGNLTMALAMLGTGICASVAFWVLTRTWRVSHALTTVAYLDLGGTFLIPRIWPAEFSRYAAQLAKTFDTAYREAMGAGSATNQVALDRFHDLVVFAVYNLQPGLWSFGTVTAAFVGMLFLLRGLNLRWRMDRIRIPFHAVYLLIAGLALTLPGSTRASGINLLLMLSSLFLIQGISVTLFHWKNLFRDSILLTVVLIIAIALNPFFIVLIALLGMVDMWFDIRKIAHEEEIDESDPGE